MKPISATGRMFVGVFVVAVILLATQHANAQPLGTVEGISSRIEAVKPAYKGAEPTGIRFVITNNTDKPINVLKWNTPLEGFNGNIFQVKRDGVPVSYIGRVIKRGAPRPEDYVNIGPGKSISAIVNLSQAYEIYESGDYTVEFKSRILDIGHDEPTKLVRKTLFMPKGIRSNTVSFKLLEKRERPPLPPVPPRRGTEAKVPVFKDCSQSQQNTLTTADGNARTNSTDSYTLLTTVPEDKRSACERYTYWFGTYDATRYNTVTNHFQRISNAFANETVTYNCGCDENYYAYVYPNRPYEIYLCNVFWTAPATGTDSQFGTLIHEMSHFNVVAGTDDHVYGQAGAHNLATTNPADAIDNADSHEYFAENTPARVCEATPTGPDLVVESLTHSPSNPTTQTQITFTAVVRNMGTGQAGPSTVSFRVGGETPPGRTFAVPMLAPNQAFTVSRQEKLAVAQNYRNTVIADVNNDVRETDETNNQRTDDYTVTAPICVNGTKRTVRCTTGGQPGTRTDVCVNGNWQRGTCKCIKGSERFVRCQLSTGRLGYQRYVCKNGKWVKSGGCLPNIP